MHRFLYTQKTSAWPKVSKLWLRFHKGSYWSKGMKPKQGAEPPDFLTLTTDSC